MDKFGIGQPVRRKEDRRLLTGAGTFTDDISRPTSLGRRAALATRPCPHRCHEPRGGEGDARRARGPDRARRSGRRPRPVPVQVEVPASPAASCGARPRPILQTDAVRFVGDRWPGGGRDRMQAMDAAEAIEVEYDILPSVTDTATALDAEAPVIWPEHGSNLCVHWSSGREAETDAAFARAARTCRCGW
jgi:carbon-monoxide dehydrogenase large subunit